MWSRTYSRTVAGLSREEIYAVWSDIDRWPEWLDDVEAARLEGPFTKGVFFAFKPKGGPNLRLEVTEATAGKSFTDVTRFPLARMYDAHELIDRADGVEIRSTVSIEGPLSILWRKIVAENIARDAPAQTEKLIAHVRALKSEIAA